MTKELRMAEHQVEIEALLALCHHSDGRFNAECDSCVFRQQACLEHLRRVGAEAIAALSGLGQED